MAPRRGRDTVLAPAKRAATTCPDDIDRQLAGLAAVGLPVSRSTGSGEIAPVAARWPELLARIRAERITGHAVAAAKTGAWQLTQEQHDELAEAHTMALAVDLRLEHLLLWAIDRFASAGIPLRVLKGAALAHLVYADAALRSFGDLDLLVPAERYDDAIRLLVVGGGHVRYREPRPGFTRRFGKGVCVEMPDGLEIDVHRAFAAGPFGIAMRPAELFETQGARFCLGGREVRALGADAALLHACYHAALGDPAPRLVSLRDIAELLMSTRVTIDAQAVLDRACRWRSVVVVQRALALTESVLGIHLDHELVDRVNEHRPSRFERRALAAYVGTRRSYARQATAGLVAVPGFRAKAAYAGALVFPDRRYVDERDGGYARRALRAAREAVRQALHE